MIKRVDNNGLVHLVTNIRKPRKWRRYEYLRSTGTLYINTGYKVGPANNTNIKLYVDVTATSTGVGNRWWVHGMGGGSSMGALHVGIGNGSTGNTIPFVYGNGLSDITTSIKGTLGTRYKYTLDLKNLTYKITNSSGTSLLDLSNISRQTPKYTVDMTIFAWNKASTGRIGYSHSDDVYEYKLWDNDILVRHMVPAEYNGLYGMWDLVEDKFYGNSGTGSFTVGPEMKNYDEIYEVRKTSSLLPAGVELYDYIQSSGTLWIDTKFIPDDTSGIKLEAYCTTLGGDHQIIGCRQDSGNTRWWINFSSTLELSWNTWEPTINNYTNRWVLIEHNYLNSRVGKVDGVEKRTNYPTLANILYSAYLFNAHLGTNTLFLGRIKYVQITKGNKTARNFLPCTYLGEPGMWDTVENKFYRNQGTGLFTLGNKITLKEYEYLEKSSTVGTKDYINTGVSGFTMNNIKCICKVSINDALDSAFFGTRGNYYLFYNLSGNYFWPTSQAEKHYGTLQINTPYIVDWNKGHLTVKDESGTLFQEASRSNNTIQGYNLYIFNFNPTDSRTSQSKIYYFKIYINDLLIRDFIPISYNGTPGLWDKVEWKFYANAGTGSFTLGPEKTSGIYPVWTPIEYLESTGTLWIDTEIENTVPTKYNLIGAKIGERTSNKSGFFGSDKWLYSLIFYTGDSNLRWCDTNKCYDYTISSGIFYNIECIKEGIMYVNNNSASLSTDSNTGSGNIKLFVGASYAASSVRIASFKMYSGEILLRDFIPVRIGNTGYLFDKVTGKMFGNSGTGNFVLGPDINL